ncbi:T9SS type A sorting domain-containing protein [Hanstruepera flava]|uniref:T9SS type A sorting domain-containing protein n=1 Tax=Hanstruepera flava TaxID=2930218 RepID=UPI0020280676|nr:T9SS type A sorting domain-containing protein [Hanstruepera flava]
MNKNYFFTVLFTLLALTGFSQIIDDDFESYNLGPFLPTAHWTNWSQNPSPSNNAENIIISDTQASSGTKSGFIGNGGIQDAILLLGNLSSGQYTLEFNMYVPSGSEGYFNIQGTIPGGALSGIWNSGDIYFNQGNAAPGVGIDLATNVTFNFPHDVWFPVSIAFDLDSPSHTYQMTINGTVANPIPTDFQSDPILGGIDFYSASSSTTAFYDDIVFDVTSLSVDEFSKEEVSVYPNPVLDRLNIESTSPVTSISIYNILGKKVKEIQSDNPIKEIDMTSLSNGIYLIKVSAENKTQTIKVIK